MFYQVSNYYTVDLFIYLCMYNYVTVYINFHFFVYVTIYVCIYLCELSNNNKSFISYLETLRYLQFKIIVHYLLFEHKYSWG